MDAQLFEGGFEQSTERRNRSTLAGEDCAKNMKREAFILTGMKMVADKLVKRAKLE